MSVSDYISPLSLLVSYLGFGLAIFSYLKSEKDRSTHVLLVLYKQLEAIGPWCSSNNDGYYELTQKQKFDYYWPFYIIFDIANTPLVNLSTQSGYISLSEGTIGKVNELNQNILRIKSIENFRYKLVTSNYKLARSIDNKMTKYLTENKKNPIFEHFEREITDKERHMLEKLKEWGNDVHLVRIGNIHSNAARHQWGVIHKEVNSRLCKLAKLDKRFTIIVAIYLALLFLPFIELLGSKIDIMNTLLILLLSLSYAFLIELNLWRFHPDNKLDYCKQN